VTISTINTVMRRSGPEEDRVNGRQGERRKKHTEERTMTVAIERERCKERPEDGITRGNGGAPAHLEGLRKGHLQRELIWKAV
jgi:hypothetical protein